MVAAFAPALSGLGSYTSQILVAAASGSNAAIVPIIGDFAHRCIAKRDAYRNSMLSNTFCAGGMPANQRCTVGTESVEDGGFRKISGDQLKT